MFTSGPLRAIALAEADIPALQAFFERNPEYYHLVRGEAPRPNEAHEEYTLLPPLPYAERWVFAIVDESGEWVGMGNVLRDLLAKGVWHIGTYVVATSQHGRGVARAIYADMEAWMRSGGAQWIRLGVVVGNERGERFWERSGYVEVRKRHDVPYGTRVNTLRVMVKPLRGGSLPEYLALVARDRPESP